MPDAALELTLDAEGEAAVREAWAALGRAGVPNQASHPGPTNAPHVTLAAAAAIPTPVVELARDVISPVLPAPLGVRGVLLLGPGRRVTIAQLVEPPAALAAAAVAVRSATPGVRHAVWTPHVTLARRVPRAEIPLVLEVLDRVAVAPTLTAARVRLWDPATGTARPL